MKRVRVWIARGGDASSRMLKRSILPRLLKKVQIQGGKRCEARGVLIAYAAGPRERANAVDGPFSVACKATRPSSPALL